MDIVLHGKLITNARLLAFFKSRIVGKKVISYYFDVYCMQSNGTSCMVGYVICSLGKDGIRIQANISYAKHCFESDTEFFYQEIRKKTIKYEEIISGRNKEQLIQEFKTLCK